MKNKDINETKRPENEPPVRSRESTGAFALPTLDQFMDLISGEKETVAAAASGYNVYNKYNKSS